MRQEDAELESSSPAVGYKNATDEVAFCCPALSLFFFFSFSRRSLAARFAKNRLQYTSYKLGWYLLGLAFRNFGLQDDLPGVQLGGKDAWPQVGPDGQSKFPHLWPPQIPPGKTGWIMTT
ncbi:MAG: hypothetical protein Q8S01_05635, partial [Ignavibacteria bacterium]|nr:hypothetical protein [Ignavibacteria bacterium]